MTAQIHLFPCLQDNFGVLLHDPESGATAAIDAPEAAPVEAALKATGWRLTDILVTHHHADHTGGIAELKQQHRCRVVAPQGEAARIPAGRCDRARERQGQGRLARSARVRDAGPHRRPYQLFLPVRQACLRRRHAVLDRLRARHRGHAGDDVAVAAETARPARRHADLLRPRIHQGQHPLREDDRTRQLGAQCAGAEVEKLLAAHKPTIPSTIGEEKKANPFLRADVPEVAKSVGLAGSPAWKVFAEIRERKNRS